MLMNKEIRKIFSDILHNKHVELSLMGSVITAEPEEKNIHLSAPVYWGGNYIPQSVRECLKQRLPYDHSTIRTFLTVSEEKFEITLNFMDELSSLKAEDFMVILEEFSYLANEWREWLDRHDKNDLVYVRVT